MFLSFCIKLINSCKGFLKMIDKIVLIAHLLFLGILLNSNCVSAINRDHKHNASLANHSYYDNERESRQFPTSGYGTGAGLGGVGGLGGLSGYGGKYTSVLKN
jgi:hypothetical protein